ncbi:MAG: EF-P lysine aminoacylase EpmA [Rhodanobacteraceae bacterium]
MVDAIVVELTKRPPPHPDPLPWYGRGRGGRQATQQRTRERAAFSATPSSGTPSLPEGVPAAATTPSPPTVSPSGERRPQAERVALGEEAARRAVGASGKQAAPRTGGDRGIRETRRHAALHLRARLNALIRGFFAERGVTEVETPILSAAGNTEPNIEGFATTFAGPVAGGASERFLRTSAEYPMKRLLAAGFGDCYELGRVFRNGEAGRSHNPEFTMLEWYRVGFDHHRLALETARLVRAALELVQRDAEVATASYRDWFRKGLGLDPFTADEAALREPLRDFSIDPEELRRDDWLDLLVTHRLQPALPKAGITMVYDFPASQCSLARIRSSRPPVAERFELYLGQRELANGYHELNDAAEQRTRFLRENALRAARGQRELPLDENLLRSLNALPDCAGVALGIDRLLMCLLDSDDIADVLAFPFAEA